MHAHAWPYTDRTARACVISVCCARIYNQLAAGLRKQDDKWSILQPERWSCPRSPADGDAAVDGVLLGGC